ncbi:MAG: sugar transferase [bacterium]|nr:sugar transferase [bacterium]
MGLKKFAILLSDLFVFYGSLALFIVIRYPSDFLYNWNLHYKLFSILFLILIFSFYASDLYELDYWRNKTDLFSKTLKVMAINFTLAITLFYFFQTPIAPKTNLFLFTFLFTFLFLPSRLFMAKALKLTLPSKKALFLGNEKYYQKVSEFLRNNPHTGYKIVAFAPTEKVNLGKDRVKVIPDHGQLFDFLSKNKVKVVISSLNPHLTKESVSSLYNSIPLNIEFLSLNRFYEDINSKVSLDALDEFWFLENLAKGEKKIQEIVKRGFDFFVSLLLGTVFLPIVPFIIIAVKITSPGPILFKQTRVGISGKNFKIIKFRTMVKNAEKNGPQWAEPNDPRVTGVGGFLRRTHLDEIPQLLNVLVGNMSLVGPRPERPEFEEKLSKEIPFYSIRHLVKPGITGMTQIRSFYETTTDDAREKLEYELYYIKNRNFFMDLKIILKTVHQIFKAAGR